MVAVNLVLIIVCIVALSVTTIVESQSLASSTVRRVGQNHLDRISDRLVDTLSNVERQNAANLAAVTVAGIAADDATRLLHYFYHALRNRVDILTYAVSTAQGGYVALEARDPLAGLVSVWDAIANATRVIERPLKEQCVPLDLSCELLRNDTILDSYLFDPRDTLWYAMARRAQRYDILTGGRGKRGREKDMCDYHFWIYVYTCMSI